MPVVLNPDLMARLAEQVTINPLVEITVDLEKMEIRHPALTTISFSVEERLRNKMLTGLDDIDEILEHSLGTTQFESTDRLQRPWIYDWR